MPLLRRTTIIVLELLAALAAGATILAGLAIWRLTLEPVPLRFLTPYIERALTSEDGTFTVDIEDTVLTWEGWERLVDVRARGVQIVGDKGPLATLPEISIGLSAQALLRGMVAPKSVQIRKPQLRLVRTEEGQIEFGVVDAGGDSRNSIQRLMANLLTPLDPSKATGYLSRISVVGASMELVDRKLAVSYRATDADIGMERDQGGVKVSYAIATDIGGDQGVIAGSLTVSANGESIDIESSFEKIRPAAFAGSTAALAPLANIRLPLSGKMSARIGTDKSAAASSGTLRIETASFDFKGTEGEIAIPELYELPLKVTQVELKGRLEQDGSLVIIDRLSANLNGPTLQTSGSISLIGKDLGMRLRTELTDVPSTRMAEFWPNKIATEQREWIASIIRGGRITQAFVDLDALITSEGGEKQVKVSQAKAEASFTDMTILYLDSMPPITNLKGVARLSGDQLVLDVDNADILFGKGYPRIYGLTGRLTPTDVGFDFEFTSGNFSLDAAGVPLEAARGKAHKIADRFDVEINRAFFNGLEFGNANISVTKLDAPEPEVAADFVIRGDVERVIGVLEKPPFNLNRPMFKPKGLSGSAILRAALKFPASERLTIDQIKPGIIGRLANIKFDEGPMGAALSKGDFNVNFGNDYLEFSGNAEVNGVPARVSWQEELSERASYRSNFVFVGQIGDSEIAKLIPDAIPYLSGAVKTRIEYTDYDRKNSIAFISADLTNAAVTLPQLQVNKKQNVRGEGRATIRFVDGKPTSIEPFDINLEGSLTASGNATFAPNGDVARASFSRLAFGGSEGTSIRFAQINRSDKGFEVQLVGDRLSVEPLINSTDGDLKQPFGIGARFDRILIDEGRELKDVALQARYDGSLWRAVKVAAKLPGGASLEVAMQETGGPRTIVIKSDSAAQSLKFALPGAAFDSLDRGAIDIRANIKGFGVPEDAGLPKGMEIDGRVEISNFRLLPSEAVQTACKVTLSDSVSNAGMDFDLMQVDLLAKGTGISIRNLTARGKPMGLRARGDIDFQAKQVNLEALIVPINTINDIVSGYPGLLPFVSNTDDRDLLAIPYNITGPFNSLTCKPQRPLSEFSPELFRGIFGLTPADAGVPKRKPLIGQRNNNQQ